MTDNEIYDGLNIINKYKDVYLKIFKIHFQDSKNPRKILMKFIKFYSLVKNNSDSNNDAQRSVTTSYNYLKNILNDINNNNNLQQYNKYIKMLISNTKNIESRLLDTHHSNNIYLNMLENLKLDIIPKSSTSILSCNKKKIMKLINKLAKLCYALKYIYNVYLENCNFFFNKYIIFEPEKEAPLLDVKNYNIGISSCYIKMKKILVEFNYYIFMYNKLINNKFDLDKLCYINISRSKNSYVHISSKNIDLKFSFLPISYLRCDDMVNTMNINLSNINDFGIFINSYLSHIKHISHTLTH